MRRDFVINILLIIAGIVLAFVLFGAGAMWRMRSARTSLNK
jgi:cytochrome c biogenesis protein CcdA